MFWTNLSIFVTTNITNYIFYYSMEYHNAVLSCSLLWLYPLQAFRYLWLYNLQVFQAPVVIELYQHEIEYESFLNNEFILMNSEIIVYFYSLFIIMNNEPLLPGCERAGHRALARPCLSPAPAGSDCGHPGTSPCADLPGLSCDPSACALF